MIFGTCISKLLTIFLDPAPPPFAYMAISFEPLIHYEYFVQYLCNSWRNDLSSFQLPSLYPTGTVNYLHHNYYHLVFYMVWSIVLPNIRYHKTSSSVYMVCSGTLPSKDLCCHHINMVKLSCDAFRTITTLED